MAYEWSAQKPKDKSGRTCVGGGERTGTRPIREVATGKSDEKFSEDDRSPRSAKISSPRERVGDGGLP